ncbi:hypothetical protein HII36_22760 [Nonomuraea sp. NN258]|uniref:hypothetical protein n=1 Tax=Nonomuraea antri TaxID=2730852 RepID=UPI001569A788|nr:hypothetical protein [Nonomuraea antri]NRQ34635.1 hypothetical protein [Nonomuraea antri]
MDAAEAGGHAWRASRSRGDSIELDRQALARLIEYDADPFEVELYEWSSDPLQRLLDRARRSYAGQYRRHLRRRRDRDRDRA